MKYVVLGALILWLLLEIAMIIKKGIEKKRANKARANAQTEETGKGVEENASNFTGNN